MDKKIVLGIFEMLNKANILSLDVSADCLEFICHSLGMTSKYDKYHYGEEPLFSVNKVFVYCTAGVGGYDCRVMMEPPDFKRSYLAPQKQLEWSPVINFNFESLEKIAKIKCFW